MFGRTTGKTLYSTGGSSQTEIIAKTLEYVSNGSYSSYLVSGENYSEPGSDGIPKETVFQYGYNTRGNITGISEYRAYEEETYTQSFSYDGLSQLVREDSSRENATYVYVYDGNGNILEKNKYAYGYTDAAHKDAAGSVSYTYSTGDWKDLLTAIGRRTISYDPSLNPENWTGANSVLTWTGRRLDNYTPDGSTLISYNYNSDGLRTKKAVTSSGTTTEYEYVYDSGELIRETRTVKVGEIVTSQKAIDYLRLGGELIGFRLYGSSGNAVDYTSYDDYFYARTANGEIRIIYDEDGFVAARYSYDAWGRITGIDEEYSSCIGALNSIRYKDYYYDTESGFYYLQSRYYDPSVCRFISADSTDYLGASGSVLSFNLFAYCENGSINGKDPTGTGPFKAIGIQFSLSIGSIVIGFERLWSLDSGRFYAFFFAGSAASFCPNSMVQSERALMEDMMYIIRKVPKFSISNIQLFKKLSISVSFIAVLGNRYSVFPEDYRGWFTGISLSYYYVQVSGAIGHTG